MNTYNRKKNQDSTDDKNSEIDWSLIHNRLENLAHRLAQDFVLSEDQTRVQLQARAQILAQPLDQKENAEIIEVLTFSINQELYAIKTDLVIEIVKKFEITPVPGAANIFAGITNIRGEIITILDFQKMLGLFFSLAPETLPETPEDKNLIILKPETGAIGILVGQIRSMVSLFTKDINEPSSDLKKNYKLGVTSDACLILNLTAMLLDERLKF